MKNPCCLSVPSVMEYNLLLDKTNIIDCICNFFSFIYHCLYLFLTLFLLLHYLILFSAGLGLHNGINR